MLHSLRFMGATDGAADTVRHELRNTKVQVEYYWNGKWVPARSTL